MSDSIPQSPSLDHRLALVLADIRARRSAAALRRLAEDPTLVRSNPHVAAAAGEAEIMGRFLTLAPQLVGAAAGARNWTPLLYAAASTLGVAEPARAAGIVAIVDRLLDAGADPNSATTWEGPEEETPLSALYHACMADNVPVVRRLLERGADPNDGESLYHAAERNHRDCLELLKAHGADLSGRHARWRNTPLFFLAGYSEDRPASAPPMQGMRWLLENGADPNVTSEPTGETPLHRVVDFGGSADTVAMLLDRGAAVDTPRADGRTALALAVRAGNDAIVRLIEGRGADPARVRPVDRFLGACRRADGATARALSDAHPDLVATLSADDRNVVLRAAQRNEVEALRLMADLGFDLSAEGTWPGTPLHNAAWWGRVDAARLLVERGAPTNVRDFQYGSSPLAWTAHGSTNCRRADDDYVTILDLLLDAGATLEYAINRWDEPPHVMGTPPVTERLNARLPLTQKP